MLRPPEIIAHRGRGPWSLPENSVEGMEASWAAGVRWVECDVWAAADGSPLVIHDETLDRTTDRSGLVSDLRCGESERVSLRNPAGCVTESKLPTLDRMLSRMPPDRAVMIEIKPPNCRALVRRVIELVRGFAGRCAIQSFDEANLYHARELGLSSELGLLVENENALAVTINNPWATVRIDYRLATADVVRALSAQGKVVGVWTVNHREDIERMARLDVDQIITDEPILAMATIAGL